MIKSNILRNGDDLKECFKVRFEVFIEEQGFDEAIEIDEYDNVANHVLISKNETPIATARFFLADGYYKIGRVCVLKEYRKLKLGKMLLDIIEEDLRKTKIDKVYLNAQYDSKDFYLKNGYEEVGTIFFEEGCKHIKMFKEIKL